MIYILFVQVFTFFDIQFWGLLGLAINILTLGALRYMINQESKSGVKGAGRYGIYKIDEIFAEG